MAARPGLTKKQEAFVQAFLETNNASEAYRRAYDPENNNPKRVYASASSVANHPKVKAEITRLRTQVQDAMVEKIVWTREKSCKILIEIAERGSAKDPDKINAVKTLNSMHGFDIPEGGGGCEQGLVALLKALGSSLPD